jgi:hypothetical protein
MPSPPTWSRFTPSSVAERAELLREHEALQALLIERLKNEEEIMKKWISLI